MKSKVLVEKAVDIAKSYKTLYVMGCFGAPMTTAAKTRYINNGASGGYNARAARKAMINAATADTFGFDCVGLIKGILWGWAGDKSKTYGGAAYASNSVPDVSADGMIAKCSKVSTTGWDTMTPGEVVWMSGHIGIYMGDGLAVECSPAFANKVQITAVGNIGAKSGYSTRKWTKHGFLPYVDYSDQTKKAESETADTGTASASTAGKKVEAAKKYDKSLAGTYKVNAASGLRLRTGAGTGKDIIATLKNGTAAKNYGYYNLDTNGVKWLYVTAEGKTGFVSSKFLTR
jgi:hypothetical protein